jgi:hypothetical protein
MDHRVGLGDQRVHDVALHNVALKIFRPGPPARGGIECLRAIPMSRSTSGASSSASTAEMPISPIGPVTATVSPTRRWFPPGEPAQPNTAIRWCIGAAGHTTSRTAQRR